MFATSAILCDILVLFVIGKLVLGSKENSRSPLVSNIDNTSGIIDSNNSETYETYSDEIAGYSLEYPADWNVDASSSPSLSSFYKGTRGFEVQLWDDTIFSLLDLRDIGETAVNSATDDENEKLEESLHSYVKKIDSEKGVTFMYSESDILKKVVSVKYDDKAYDFTYSSLIANFEDDEEIMNHFLDSIRFN